MAYIHPKDAVGLCLTADKSEVVQEDSPEAAWVLVAPGGTLSDEEAARWGLVAEEEEPEPEVKAKEEPAANKLAAPAAQNKRKGKGA